MSRNFHDETNRYLHIDNRSLVEECLKGDKDALSFFYTRFAPKMLALIRRYVGDSMDAEDILHDGFIIALTRLKTLRDYDHVDYWLATIMKNLSLQFLRLQDVGTMLHEIPETEDTPLADDFLDMETLESLIKELPTGYRNVFRLAVLENKSHREIAQILGISPNTSSSQLFRARMMMQRLIKDYRIRTGALILLLAAVPLTIFLTTSRKKTFTEANTLVPEEASMISAQAPRHNTLAAITPLKVVSPKPSQSNPIPAYNDSDSTAVTSSSTQEFPSSPKDTIPEIKEPTKPEHEDYSRDEDYLYYAESQFPLPKRFSRTSRWSMGLGVNPGIGNFKSDNGDTATSVDTSQPGDSDDPENKTEEPATLRIPTRAGSSFRDYNTVPHRNSMPVAVSLLVSKGITGALSAETGLTYTYLHTEFDGKRSTADCRWHYIGIPLKLKLRLFSSSRFSIYASAGGAIDIPVYSDADVKISEGTPDLKNGSFTSSAVWSVTTGFGASVKLSDHFEIFLEPTFQYRFKHHYSVPNAWTDNPIGISLPIGLRFNM